MKKENGKEMIKRKYLLMDSNETVENTESRVKSKIRKTIQKIPESSEIQVFRDDLK